MRNFSNKFVEIVETHILCSVTFFFQTRAFNEITWKNIAEPDMPHMTVWRMCVACWIQKAANTHSEYVMLVAFPR